MKLISRLLVFLLVIVCTFVSTGTGTVADTGIKPGTMAYVTADYLNLRDAPQGNKITQAAYGTPLRVLSGPDNNNYYKVQYNGVVYFAYGQYLTGQYIQVRPTSPRVQKVYEYVFVDGTDLYPLVFVTRSSGPLALRREPDKNSDVVEWLYNGTPLLMVNDYVSNGYGYCRVHTLDGQVGYAHEGSLSMFPPDGVHYKSNGVDPCPDLSGLKFKFSYPVALDRIELKND